MTLPIKPFKISELVKIISFKLKRKKAPEYDLLTSEIMKQLPEIAFTLMTRIYNAILRRGHFPSQWKVAQIVLILKPGKSPEETTSYRPISLLLLMGKIFEKLFLNRLMLVLEELHIIPDHQFGLRQNHATIEQIDRLVDSINLAFQEKKYCSAAFLDVSQAFDRVWHKGFLFKLKLILPYLHYQILKSYLTDRYFTVKFQNKVTKPYPILAGVPQGSVLGLVLYQIYTSNIPTSDRTVTATYADDTAILAVNKDADKASEHLQKHLNNLRTWLRKWKIKVNETKSIHITFALRYGDCPSVKFNNLILT